MVFIAKNEHKNDTLIRMFILYLVLNIKGNEKSFSGRLYVVL
jgi:hypothetical protein